jgi:hypothetical protein
MARSTQLAGCEEDLRRTINGAVALHNLIRKKGFFSKSDTDRQHFQEWVTLSFDRSQHQGDTDAADRLLVVLQKCGFLQGVIPEPTDGKPAKVEKGAKVEDIKWQLREQTHILRRLSKELVSRVRSLRFFDVVRKLQKNGEEARMGAREFRLRTQTLKWDGRHVCFVVLRARGLPRVHTCCC